MAKLAADEEEELLSAIARQILRHAPRDGETTTLVPGLTLYRANSTALIQRGILKPSVCVVAQGEKVVQAGADTTLRYGRGNFLASSIDMPVVGQVIEASKSKPYLVAFYELTPHDVLSVLADAKIQVDTTAPNTSATFVGTCDARLLDVVLRSLKSLDDEREARFLAPLLRKELSYRLVTGPSAFAVCQSAWLARSDDGIGRAVDWLKSHFKEPLSIPDLAKRSNMSPSTLQHKFKATVMMAPLQYQATPARRGAQAVAPRTRRCNDRCLRCRLRKPVTVHPRIPAPLRHAAAARHQARAERRARGCRRRAALRSRRRRCACRIRQKACAIRQERECGCP
jgi:hypothetical protein